MTITTIHVVIVTLTLISATYLEVGPAVHNTFSIIPDAVLLITAPIISSPDFTFCK